MFEASKFKKRYQLLVPYIKDKELIKKLVNDKEFYTFYQKEIKEVTMFISNLKKLYSEEEIEKILFSELNIDNPKSINFTIFRVKQAINNSKMFDDGKIDVLKTISWAELKKMTNVYDTIFKMCFDKYNPDNLKAGYYELSFLFEASENEDTKKRLLEMAKSKQLEFLVSFLKDLNECKIASSDLDHLFNEDKEKLLINPKTKEKLGEVNYKKLIRFYYKGASLTEKENIKLLIEHENYELIDDILHLNRDYRFSRYVKKEEVDKDIFSLYNVYDTEILSIILSHMGINNRLNLEYLDNLRYSISNDKYETFYNENKDLIDLLSKLSYDSFSKCSIEEKKKLYTYAKSLDEDKKKALLPAIETLNQGIKELYQEEYCETFNKATSIIDKAEEREVKDSSGKKHKVAVYELKDEEPFTFLITVMHHKARLDFQNMYGRPAHKLTIDDPSNFTKDLRGGSEIISTSMINEQFIDTFVGDQADVMYAFSSLKKEDIIAIAHEDAGLPPKIEENQSLFPRGVPTSPSDLIRTSARNRSYNEIAIRRKEEDGTRVMPTAIICYDRINDTSIKHAQYFNIPIVVINTKTYRNLKHYTKPLEEQDTNNRHR